MSKMQKIKNGNRIVGALVERTLRNEGGSIYGREFVVYAAPGERKPALMQGVIASLKMQYAGDTDDMWNQMWVYWGVSPE